ncbi:hypothetical protein KUV89_06120 [Marinobacter hydrocarbonoclasticus]|nr:hypothetical protein [Marinobacter nauticus]
MAQFHSYPPSPTAPQDNGNPEVALLRWRVEGIWHSPQGKVKEVRHFSGSRGHIERVLARLEGKGRLLRRLSLHPA